jgi:hypothetical protein
MPLARARCPACTLPLGDAPHRTIAVACSRCAASNLVAVAGDGQPAGFDTSFDVTRLLGWLSAARLAHAAGRVGIAVGACSRCAWPLLLSSTQAVSLACPHCETPIAGTARERIVDQWTEPWARLGSGSTSLEFRLARIDAKDDRAAGCAACGAQTPPQDPQSRCRHCGNVAWIERDTERFQLGVRVDGTRGGQPFDAVVPIVQGEAMLRSDAFKSASENSGRSLLGVSAVGCSATVGVLVVVSACVAMLIHFAHC